MNWAVSSHIGALKLFHTWYKMRTIWTEGWWHQTRFLRGTQRFLRGTSTLITSLNSCCRPRSLSVGSFSDLNLVQAAMAGSICGDITAAFELGGKHGLHHELKAGFFSC